MKKITEEEFELLKEDAIGINYNYGGNCDLSLWYELEKTYYLIRAKNQWYQYDKLEINSKELQSIYRQQYEEWIEFIKEEEKKGFLHQW